ncbi:Na+/H+ antiporter [Bacillus sp. NPDC077027]|uniref:Na+/H+ antiporter n=1 Tax=Bacillus sp. NPDC077027 TaxID=3390548 RepID=UPI003D0007C1
MEIFLAVLVLLALIASSNIINRFVPFIPVPLIQVGLGILIAAFPSGLHISLNPELFFVLFIAPLLFNDGKRTPRDELWKLRAPILLLALGLVFATVIVAGYTIHWMIPSIPLPAAFALAAILSPTDVVAVSALSSRVNMPKGIMRLLEGEGLMNDASGLVAFKFAIAATVTGAFSIAEASFSFVIIAIGGLLTGFILSFFIIRFRFFLRRLGMDDVTMHIILQILTPFVIYLAAEEIGVSGILAVVAGGVTHAIEKDRMEANLAKLQIASSNTWSIILFILNGLVFVILGLQIPDVATVIFKDEAFNNLQVLGYIIAITLCLMVLRFLWVWLFWAGKWNITKKKNVKKPKLRASLLMTFSGVRGAVTLAGAFSIPFALDNGSPFPERHLIIFLAAGVILLTLVMASILLPLLSEKKDKKADMDMETKIQHAKRKLFRSAIKTLKEGMNAENSEVTLAVINDYRQKLRNIQREPYQFGMKKQERKIRLHGIKAEQLKLQQLIDEEKINIEEAYELQERFHELEMLYSNSFKIRFSKVKFLRLLQWLQLWRPNQHVSSGILENEQSYKQIRKETAESAVESIKKHMTDDNQQTCHQVIGFYNQVIFRCEHGPSFFKQRDRMFDRKKKELNFQAVQSIRNEVQTLYEKGEINRDIAHHLREYTNDMEAVLLDNN